jgi:hypothetical protein
VPGGALGMGTGVATIVFGTLAVWDLARSYDLTKIPWTLFWLQVVAVAAVAVVRAYLRREYPAMHLPALAAVAVGGLMLAVSILLETPSATADTIDKLGQSGAGLAFPMAAAGALFLMPNRPRLNLTRRLAYAGFVELAVFLCVKPWIDNSDMVKRMNVAMIAIAIILGLIALTFFLIDYMDLRRDRKAGGEPEPSG